MTGSPDDLKYAPINTVTHFRRSASPFIPAINSAVASENELYIIYMLHTNQLFL